MTEQERNAIDTRGLQCRALITSEAFKDTIGDLELRYYRTWHASESAVEREGIHARATVLKDLVAELSGHVAIMEQLEQNDSLAHEDVDGLLLTDLEMGE